MQLVAYGAQDGSTLQVIRKSLSSRLSIADATNFSMEAIEQTINGTVGFGSSVSVTISRNGDLVGRTYVEWQPSSLITSQCICTRGPFIGNTLLKELK